ncbi:MAG: GntR family transcriptional regulator [Dorea sp.]|nr:GntR family transcriptional regulator [Dorea sp.]
MSAQPQSYTIQIEAPISDQATSIIRNMILSGQLKPGSKITESQFTSLLKVSASPIKAAFRQLHTEGLIETIPRSGSYVSMLPDDMFTQTLYQISSLEGNIAYFAAIHATDEQIQIMTQALDSASALLQENSDETAIELEKINKRFHDQIHKACGNPYLLKLLENVQSVSNEFNVLSLRESKERLRTYVDHCNLLDAIKQKKPELAEQLIIMHMRRNSQYLLAK